MTDFISGFLVSLSLIVAIGAQNAFVLRQGLRREHVGIVVAICAASDAVLIAAGVMGFGAVSAAVPGLGMAMRIVGAAFLIVYGALRFRAAWRGGEVLETASAPRGKVVATALLLTWANPHVYLDTLMLIGSISAQHEALPFAVGAVLASLVFFTALGFGARWLAPVFARPRAWVVLECAVGALMWVIAASLLIGA
ncbi:LysE/ArgO family amino acid transporter [Cereibacter sp. SYSU M97828]|nr:LysE/ArgO family amino acid transporter [Cereibacter flavus]